MFQSTHLHEVWLPVSWVEIVLVCFNPHTYMRCDLWQQQIGQLSQVSIHTPTWGVTLSGISKQQTRRFQSTHLHEVWQTETNATSMGVCFNPHTYMRCDTIKIYPLFSITSFNPHTYMRCDHDWLVVSRYNLGFNPHTYMRCDDVYSADIGFNVFQSTHLHEVWPDLFWHYGWFSRVSIHTPTWGVTQTFHKEL